MGILRAFRTMLVFLNGQLYGCQVTMNSIYGLDMVAKKGLWWSTRDVLSVFPFRFVSILGESGNIIQNRWHILQESRENLFVIL